MLRIKLNCSIIFIDSKHQRIVIVYDQNLPSKSFPSKSYENSCSISATFCPISPAVKIIKQFYNKTSLDINIKNELVVLRSANWVKLSVPWTSVELELQVSPLSSPLDCLSLVVSSSNMMSFYLKFACRVHHMK